ncbi:MAG: class I SAM-dependent methyltransferase [Firmicutes bacterium]|nr:class I SAM-dependent methyltransferase [Bacillota bacterium]
MKRFQITEYCHHMIEAFAVETESCIDATMGNGVDTAFLCRLAGEQGKVIAFDIQEKAVENTGKLLEREGLREQAKLVLDSHDNMDKYAEAESADIIVFNFGYLPGGDHKISTKAATSVSAVEKGLGILKKGGIMSLCIYSGGDSGYEEKEALLEYVKALDHKRYIVITHEFFNRPNDPPLPVLIKKIK